MTGADADVLVDWTLFLPPNEPWRVTQHPTDAMLETLDNCGVTYVRTIRKRNAVDMKLKSAIQLFQHAARSSASTTLVVILSGDRDYAPEFRFLRSSRFRTMLMYGGKLSAGVADNAHHVSNRWQTIVAGEDVENNLILGAKTTAEDGGSSSDDGGVVDDDGGSSSDDGGVVDDDGGSSSSGGAWMAGGGGDGAGDGDGADRAPCSSVPITIVNNVYTLLLSGAMRMSELEAKYQRYFGAPIDYRRIHFNTLRQLLHNIWDVQVHGDHESDAIVSLTDNAPQNYVVSAITLPEDDFALKLFVDQIGLFHIRNGVRRYHADAARWFQASTSRSGPIYTLTLRATDEESLRTARAGARTLLSSIRRAPVTLVVRDMNQIGDIRKSIHAVLRKHGAMLFISKNSLRDAPRQHADMHVRAEMLAISARALQAALAAIVEYAIVEYAGAHSYEWYIRAQ